MFGMLKPRINWNLIWKLFLLGSLGLAAWLAGFQQGRARGNLEVYHIGLEQGYATGISDAYTAYQTGGKDAVQIILQRAEAEALKP